MSQILQGVRELQDLLNQLKDAERRLNEIPEWMTELHQEHSARQGEIAALEEVAENAGRERRAAEAAVQDAQEKLKKYQQQISKVSNQREYGALLQEIDAVKVQISTQEEAALGSLDSAETAQTNLTELREAFRELDERYSAELARWESEKPEVARQVEALRLRVKEIKGSLPRGRLSQFERILDRYPGGALSQIRIIERPGKGQREWHCSACNYRIRPQVLVEIRAGNELIQCDSCKRILFIEESP
jgi:predicted  nucleic acid-binding Zn-ribbon protein